LVFLLLYILQPLGFSEYKGNKFLLSVGFAIVTYVSSTLCSLVIPRIINPRNSFKLSLLSAVLYGVIMGILNSVYAVIVMHLHVSSELLINISYIAFVYFILVGSILYLVSSNFQLRQKVKELTPNIPSIQESEKDIQITIHDQNIRTNDLVLSLHDFLYAEVNHNYVTIHYLCNQEVKTKDIRTTLANVLKGIVSSDVIQCHRSYIVNIRNIISATGNMNGYKLKINSDFHKIPVSRSYVDVFLSKFHPE
jgi:DNA-binding LytR/AlgR family response regulator